jgi:hypothetical protein
MTSLLRLALGLALLLMGLLVGCTRDWDRERDSGREPPTVDAGDASSDGSVVRADGGDAALDGEAGPGDARGPRDTGLSTPGDTGLDASRDAGFDAARDAQGDAAPDAAAPVDSAADSAPRDSSAPDAGPPACPINHGCPAAHPCVPNAEGFTCLGQRADWPIPLRTPGQTPAVQQIEVRTDTLIDNVTGLMWERKPAGDYRTQPLSAAHCESLELGGYSDFRLPSMIEMATWLDTVVAPQLDASLLAEPHPGLHWTSSVYVAESAAHWSVNLMDGVIRPFPDTETFQTQCVRTHAARYMGSNTARFSALGTLPVTTDRATGLTWEATIQPAQTKLSFAAAASYCDQLSLDGNSNWGVPSVLELLSTFDVSQTGSVLVVPLLGPITRSDCYWSDTRSSFLTAADHRFAVVPDNAWTEPRDTTQVVENMGLCAVRCVHD